MLRLELAIRKEIGLSDRLVTSGLLVKGVPILNVALLVLEVVVVVGWSPQHSAASLTMAPALGVRPVLAPHGSVARIVRAPILLVETVIRTR